MKTIRIALLTAIAFGIQISSSADLLWSLTPNTLLSQQPIDDNNLVVSTAANVTGTDGSEYAASAVGMSGAFDVSWIGSANNDFVRHGTTAGNTDINFETGYTEFTIQADTGYALNLASLDFDSARGGTLGTRGFEIYGAVGGAPTILDLLLDVNDEPGLTTAPTARSIDLSGAQYQGINSITFRYYTLTDSSTRSINWDNMVLSGTTVVPEPSSLGLIAVAGLWALITRRSASAGI